MKLILYIKWDRRHIFFFLENKMKKVRIIVKVVNLFLSFIFFGNKREHIIIIRKKILNLKE